MKISLSDKNKIARFIMVFKGVVGMNDLVNIRCTNDHFYLQAMDKGHSGIVEVKVMKDWFDDYVEGDDMCININTLVKVLECWNDGYLLTIEDEEERLIIELNGKKMMTKRFEIVKIDIVGEIFDIPEREYDIDITLYSESFKNVIDELQLFNDTLSVTCDEDNICLKTTGEEGSGSVKIKDGDILEYAVALNSGEIFEQYLNINKIANSCNVHKLNKEVGVYFSSEDPMKIHYSLDSNDYTGEPSYIRFFIAPKMQ